MFGNTRFLDYYSVDRSRTAQTVSTSHEGSKGSEGIILTYLTSMYILLMYMYVAIPFPIYVRTW